MKQPKLAQLLQPIKQYWKQWLNRRQNMTYAERKQQTIFIMVTAICCVVMIFCGISFYQSYTKYQALKKEEQETKKEYTSLKKEASTLNKEVAQLKDSSYVEKLARARFFLSKEGEQIYVFPQESDESVQSTVAQTTQGTNEQESTTTASN